EEVVEFLKPLSKIRGLDRGCDREFLNWTGGVPVLSVALAARLAERAEGIVSAVEVGAAAAEVLYDHADIVEGVWDAFNGEQHTAFAELLEKQEIGKSEAQ